MSLFVYVHKCNIVSHYNIKYFWFFISRVLRHSTKPNFFFVCLFQFRLLVHSVTVKALIKKKDNRSIHPMRLCQNGCGGAHPFVVIGGFEIHKLSSFHCGSVKSRHCSAVWTQSKCPQGLTDPATCSCIDLHFVLQEFLQPYQSQGIFIQE